MSSIRFKNVTKSFGAKEVIRDIDIAVDVALKSPYWNPRPVERAPLRALLESAYEGRRP